MLMVLTIAHTTYTMIYTVLRWCGVADDQDLDLLLPGFMVHSSLNWLLWMALLLQLTIQTWFVVGVTARTIDILSPQIASIRHIAFKRIAFRELREWRGSLAHNFRDIPDELAAPIWLQVDELKLMPNRDRKNLELLQSQEKKATKSFKIALLCSLLLAVVFFTIYMIKVSTDWIGDLDDQLLAQCLISSVGLFPAIAATVMTYVQSRKFGFNLRNHVSPLGVVTAACAGIGCCSEKKDSLLQPDEEVKMKHMRRANLVKHYMWGLTLIASAFAMSDFFIIWSASLLILIIYHSLVARACASKFSCVSYYDTRIAMYSYTLSLFVNLIYLCLPNSSYETFVSHYNGWREEKIFEDSFDFRLLLATSAGLFFDAGCNLKLAHCEGFGQHPFLRLSGPLAVVWFITALLMAEFTLAGTIAFGCVVPFEWFIVQLQQTLATSRSMD